MSCSGKDVYCTYIQSLAQLPCLPSRSPDRRSDARAVTLGPRLRPLLHRLTQVPCAPRCWWRSMPPAPAPGKRPRPPTVSARSAPDPASPQAGRTASLSAEPTCHRWAGTTRSGFTCRGRSAAWRQGLLQALARGSLRQGLLGVVLEQGQSAAGEAGMRVHAEQGCCARVSCVGAYDREAPAGALRSRPPLPIQSPPSGVLTKPSVPPLPWWRSRPLQAVGRRI